MKIQELLLAQLEREIPLTRRILERVPKGKEKWKPHPKSMEMGYLSALVATMPGWIASMIDKDYLDLAAGSRPDSVNLLELFDRSTAEARRALKGTSEEHLMKKWELRMKDKVLQTDIRHLAITDTFSHLAHHRAQLGVYLRLNDIALPQVYGPTADAAWG